MRRGFPDPVGDGPCLQRCIPIPNSLPIPRYETGKLPRWRITFRSCRRGSPSASRASPERAKRAQAATFLLYGGGTPQARRTSSSRSALPPYVGGAPEKLITSTAVFARPASGADVQERHLRSPEPAAATNVDDSDDARRAGPRSPKPTKVTRNACSSRSPDQEGLPWSSMPSAGLPRRPDARQASPAHTSSARPLRVHLPTEHARPHGAG